MAAALGIQGNVGGGNAAFKVGSLQVCLSWLMLTKSTGQGEAYGCAQREHYGCKRFAFHRPPFSCLPAYTVSSRCRCDPDLIRPQRHGQNDTIRKGGNNYHQRWKHYAEEYERYAPGGENASRSKCGTRC